DLAGFTQSVWLISEGVAPEATIFGENVHLLELRWSFLLYLLAVPARLVPSSWLSVAEILLVAQAIAVAIAVIPIWKLGRVVAHLRVGAATALCLGYALHPVTQAIGTVDFHPEALALPALLSMAYFGSVKRWVPYWASVAAALLAQADLGLVIAVFGLLVLGNAERIAGLWTLGIGLVWSLGLLLVAQPLIGDSGVIGGVYGEYGDSFGDALFEIVSNPLGFGGDLFGRENLALLLSLLTPMLFLPMLSLRHLLPAVPAVGMLLIIQSSGEANGLAPILAFVMVSSIFALNRLGNLGVDRVFVDPRLLVALVAVASLMFLTRSPLSPYDEPWALVDDDASDLELRAAVGRLDPSWPVRASPNVLPLLAERRFAYPMADEEPTVASVVFRSRAVLIDQRTLDQPLSASQREAFTLQMASLGFNLVNSDADGTVLLYFRP
ncbi:MAG: DUF2079 domain-containing protein, partial [Acidimicrobiales bacterium]|nr:DUF2079 domain-containing protein [Acidimicrobiales bacterium]